MERLLSTILFFVIALLPLAIRAQDKAPVQIDEFGRTNSEEIEARLDNVLVQLTSNPDAVVQFVVRRGEKDIWGSQYRTYALMKTYLIYRKIDPTRIIQTYCEPEPEKVTQIWLVHSLALLRTCSEERISVTATTMFDSAPSLNVDTDCGSCCIVDCFGSATARESFIAFAALLKQYPEAKAYVLSYGGTNIYWTSDSKGRERTIRNLDSPKKISSMSLKARRILTQNGIEKSRIVTMNAGYRDSAARMELWIVPNKQSDLPKPTPDYPKKKKSARK
ncbi:MAG: hypothetical protein WKF34_03855 [Pyrinomonadaceae bacterium]